MEGIEWYKEFLPDHEKKLEVIHFNDVYCLEECKFNPNQKKNDNKPFVRGGVSRFATAMNLYNSKEKLTIFSGDLFFPSNLS